MTVTSGSTEFLTTPEAPEHGWTGASGAYLAANTTAFKSALAAASAAGTSSQRGVVELTPSYHYVLTAPASAVKLDSAGAIEWQNYPNVELRTQGKPTGSTRATISHEPLVNRLNVSIFSWRGDQAVDLNQVISHVQLDGRKDEQNFSGLVLSDWTANNNGALALLFFFGAKGVIIRHVHGFDHIRDGYSFERGIAAPFAGHRANGILLEDCEFGYCGRGCAFVSAGIDGAGYDQIILRRVNHHHFGDDTRFTPTLVGNLTASIDLEPVGSHGIEGVTFIDCQSDDHYGSIQVNPTDNRTQRGGRGFNIDSRDPGIRKVKLLNCQSTNAFANAFNLHNTSGAGNKVQDIWIVDPTIVNENVSNNDPSFGGSDGTTWLGTGGGSTIAIGPVTIINPANPVVMDSTLPATGNQVDVYGAGATLDKEGSPARETGTNHGSATPPTVPGITNGGGGGGETLTAITSRSPTVYYALTNTSSTDLGSAGLTLTQSGTIGAKDANGWNLGGTGHLSVAHSTVFEADTGAAHRWVNSEVGLSFEAVPNSLASRQYFMSKASGAPGSRLDSSWWVFAEPDGTVVARVERNEYVTEIRTAPGYAQVGVRLRGALFFGFYGFGMMLDGRMANDGLRNVRDWFGWDHRVRGNHAAAQGYRMVCNHPLRIGSDGAGTNSNVTVRHVAVWATGATNVDPWVRTTAGIDQPDIQAIHGLSGASIASHNFAGSTVSVLLADTAATKRSKIQNASAGQVITFQAGTHTLDAGDLVVPNGVRLVGLGAARTNTIIVLSSGSEFRFGVGAGATPGNLATWSNLGNGSGDLAKGAMSWATPGTSVTLQAGDMIQFVSTVTFLTDGGGNQTAQVRSELAVVERVQGGTVFFTNPLQHAYPAAQRATTWRLRPSSPGPVSIENLTLRTFGPGSSTASPIYAWYASLRFHAMHDIRINNVSIEQQNSNVDDRTVEMHSCADVEIRNVDITNNSTDPSAAEPTHSYAFQFGGGTRLIYHTGSVFSFGWAPYVDKTFNNNGAEIGNKTGPTNQLAPSAVTQLMLDTSKGSNNILDMGGGHENYNRRDICLSSSRGGWYGGGTVLADVVGLRMQLDAFSITANRGKTGYVHHVRLVNQSNLQMYKSSGTVESWHFSNVVHPGGNSSATWGTFLNCTWTADCTNPHP